MAVVCVVLCLLVSPLFVLEDPFFTRHFQNMSLTRSMQGPHHAGREPVLVNPLPYVHASEPRLVDILDATTNTVFVAEEKHPVRENQVALVTATDYHFHWDGAEEALQDTIQERQQYADLHGYTFDFVDLRTFEQDAVQEDMAAVWKKIPVLKHIFDKRPDAEWIWWLDLDAVLMGAQSLQEYLFDRIEELQDEARHMQDTDLELANKTDGIFKRLGRIPLNETNLIVTADMNSSMINAGSFLIRRSEWSEQLIDLWLDPLFVKAALNHTIGFLEQGVLTHLVMNHKTIAQHTAAVPMTTINAFPWAGIWTWRPGSLVVHMAGCWVNHVCAHWNKEFRAVKNGLKESVSPPPAAGQSSS
jgi:hypothetical protein